VQLLAEGGLDEDTTRAVSSVLSACGGEGEGLADAVVRALPGLFVKHRSDAVVCRALAELAALAEPGKLQGWWGARLA
jgi:hypothetical protein